MKNNKGFTLIEMLVVVAIIGLLSSVVVVGLGSARQNARDARRISDIRQIQNALEVVYSSNQKYPTALPENVPKDPSGTVNGGNYAYYRSNDDDQTYNLGACLEGNRPTGVSSASSTQFVDTSFPRSGCSNCDASNAFCVAN